MSTCSAVCRGTLPLLYVRSLRHGPNRSSKYHAIIPQTFLRATRTLCSSKYSSFVTHNARTMFHHRLIYVRFVPTSVVFNVEIVSNVDFSRRRNLWSCAEIRTIDSNNFALDMDQIRDKNIYTVRFRCTFTLHCSRK